MRAAFVFLLAPLRLVSRRPVAAFLLWHALCAAALYTPNLSSGPMPFPFADKAVHFALFFVLWPLACSDAKRSRTWSAVTARYGSAFKAS